ncbi:MAG TPA: prenyltransferase, partial [Ignavibacteriales bacterium]|nr:prenyltransferase [Ignavibacteriales bacterium]
MNEFPGTIQWFLLPVALICAMTVHAGSNMISDYFDLKKGVDTKETFGSSKVLVDEILTPREVLRGGLICLAVGFLLG